MSDLPRFGRFHATAELGEGAMGCVYRAHDAELGRDVAIKALHVIRRDTILRERFLREARAVSMLVHPNVVAVYDIGSADDAPYLVMELAPGGSLKGRLERGPLLAEEARRLGIQIAQALAAAHAKEILHRDVKPANILATDGETWKLADFGMARLPGTRLTITGQFLGSPAYAAPEALNEGAFSPASDVYGLAATLYEALTGDVPYGERDLGSLIAAMKHDPPRIASAPPVIRDGIARALARDPADRPTAAEFAELLAEPRVPVVAPPRRTGWLVLAGLVALAIVVALIAGRDARAPAAALPLDGPDELPPPDERDEPGPPDDRPSDDHPPDHRPPDERPPDEPPGRAKHHHKRGRHGPD